MTNITMKEISKLAHCSPATVSRAFQSPELVGEKTRLRILQIAEQHNYIYNAAAGNLSSQKSTLIGVLMPSTNQSFFGDSLLSIQDKAQELGFSIVIGNTKYDHRVERRLIDQFLQNRVAGIIMAGYHLENEDYIRNLSQQGVPCVFTWEKLEGKQYNYVGFCNYEAAFSVTEYLISLGHTRIGLIVGPCSKLKRIKHRIDGYRAALEKHNIPFDRDLMYKREPVFTEGKEAMRSILSLEHPPTAVFAASDTLAIGAIAAAWQQGLRVPQDISIAGFDDNEFSAYCEPSLTTVRVPAREMGSRAMTYLFELINGDPHQVRQYTLPTDLIIRKSCAEPAKAGINPASDDRELI